MRTLADLFADNPCLPPRKLVGARIRLTTPAPDGPKYADVFGVMRTSMETATGEAFEIPGTLELAVQAVNEPAAYTVSPSEAELLACRACGCDHLHACMQPGGRPCSWSLKDPALCTACEERLGGGA